MMNVVCSGQYLFDKTILPLSFAALHFLFPTQACKFKIFVIIEFFVITITSKRSSKSCVTKPSSCYNIFMAHICSFITLFKPIHQFIVEHNPWNIKFKCQRKYANNSYRNNLSLGAYII